MKKLLKSILFLILISCSVFAQETGKIDPFRGDWQVKGGKTFAMVNIAKDSTYKANIVTDPTSKEAPLAALTGEKVSEEVLNLTSDSWNGKIEKGKLTITKGTEKLEMKRYYRNSPTMNAVPPKGAIVLFDGKNLDAWWKVEEKDWIIGGQPADNFKILPGGILDVVPHAVGKFESIISKQKFGDCKLHVEFRLLGQVTNGGVYFMSRYEMNIKDAYGQVGGTPIAFGNVVSSKSELNPSVNMAFPPMEWQTFDIDFRAPRFDISGTTKVENARMTVVHNGVTIYKDFELEGVKGSTGKLGDAGVGPIYLQEHGSEYQFRNIWVIDKTLKGTEKFGNAAAQAAAAGIVAPTDKESVKKDSSEKGSGEKKSGGKKGGKKGGSKSTSAESDTALLDVQPAKKGGKKGGSKNTAEEGVTTNKIAKYTGGKSVETTYDAEANPAYASTTVVLTADPSGIPAKSVFNHPGVFVTAGQLELIKTRVAKGLEPQKSAFESVLKSPFAAIDYKPNPADVVSCGPHSNPNLGCKDEQGDSDAAYTQALIWAATGNKTYAENAIKIMNAWSYTLKGGHNYANGPVQAAWCGSVWPRAAEIIRYTYKGWSDADIAKFQNMLRTQYLPTIIHGDCENGNKELAMCEALINIGVFIDDRSVFDLGVKMWRGRTPAYIYLKTDGPAPIEPPGCGAAIWGNKGFVPEFVDGILQETARDSHHPTMAFASMCNAAETAYIQGVDLYKEQGKRIMAAIEFEAQYVKPNNVPAPANLTFALNSTWEVAYNHFHNRMAFNLPKMAAALPFARPSEGNHHVIWETLTHSEMGAVGLPVLAK
jgi:hypothetical protein